MLFIFNIFSNVSSTTFKSVDALAMSFAIFVVPFIRVPIGQSCLPMAVPFTCLIPFPLIFLSKRNQDNCSYPILRIYCVSCTVLDVFR